MLRWPFWTWDLFIIEDIAEEKLNLNHLGKSSDLQVQTFKIHFQENQYFFFKKRKDWEEWEYIKFLAWKYETVDAIIMQTCIVSEEETGNSQRKLTFTYASVSWKNSWFAT